MSIEEPLGKMGVGILPFTCMEMKSGAKDPLSIDPSLRMSRWPPTVAGALLHNPQSVRRELLEEFPLLKSSGHSSNGLPNFCQLLLGPLQLLCLYVEFCIQLGGRFKLLKLLQERERCGSRHSLIRIPAAKELADEGPKHLLKYHNKERWNHAVHWLRGHVCHCFMLLLMQLLFAMEEVCIVRTGAWAGRSLERRPTGDSLLRHCIIQRET